MSQSACTPDPSALKTYGDALALLRERAVPVAERERIPLAECLGRVLAESVVSPIDVPGWAYSAMDGYAVRSAEVVESGARLPVTQRVPAGVRPGPLDAGTAARIFTGAPVPSGADAVVPQESCRQEGGAVVVEGPVTPGMNVRLPGEDVARGAQVLEAGLRLLPQHLGLAASVGTVELSVYRRLRVALFCTGDELIPPGEALTAGKIYNSNAFTARGLLESLGCEVLDLGIVADDPAATEAALRQGAAEADLILASGGVSVGEEDHVKPALERLGTLEMWRIAVRPGKPLAFGRIGETPFLGAPGNPVSLFATFLLFVRPFILRRQGRRDVLTRPRRALAGFDWPRPDRRREFHRARLERDADGRERVVVYPSRSSGVLSSVAWADGLVEIPEGRVISPGDEVDFHPFCELLS
ncbi:MAG: molybdopterin molybdotransferase MoeA [Chromatiales bacterium]|jgi:molybdopterin molybdotransferase